ncbi:HAMP domain-containing histidine kinase [Sporolactobacillus shoreae]|uniref:histidine kinase n=1 Tax=Sporolactobacillus shoreae TaxID=1465501 RepID=A0A4Z0GPC9_9BACL|nr:HAMP domain-containing sensor histidine kinase [Sporolactobacillus shoreae]TGA97855.1 HAMP domain-containing histidine kinase [Sporolactobacillus shoreae]
MTLFRKTLIKLTITNAALLILLIGLLCGAIYYYVESETYADSANTLIRDSSRPLGSYFRLDARPQAGMPLIGKPDLIVAIVGPGNRLETNWPDLISSVQTLEPFSKMPSGKVTQEKIAGASYNVLLKQLRTNEGTVGIFFIRSLGREQAILQRLLSIIIYGLVIGAVLSVVAGYFLAWRAIRPIRAAWDKQNRFVADASHELRTPLSIIQLKIEGLLKQPRRQIQETGEDISVMLDETRRLSKLVGNLLTLARSDANRLEVSLKPLDLKKMLARVTEPFSEMAEFEGKKFSLDTCSEPVVIMGDEQRIHQLMVILLDNAMKFTPEDGEIFVSCSKDNKWAKLTVSDSGIGIAEKDLPHVFDRFFQADTSRTDQRGTGLGLSIARWIVEKHRGRIEVSSIPQKGTTFTVLLPLNRKETELKTLTSEASLLQDKEKGENADDREKA